MIDYDYEHEYEKTGARVCSRGWTIAGAVVAAA